MVHHDRLASEEMHHDGRSARLLNISGAKVRETEFRYLGKYLSSRKIDFVCAVGTVCIIKQVLMGFHK